MRSGLVALILVALSGGIPVAHAKREYTGEKLHEIPVERFEQQSQPTVLTRVLEKGDWRVTVNGPLALLNNGRELWLWNKNQPHPTRLTLPTGHIEHLWFGTACAINGGFFVGLASYPEGTRYMDAAGRGGSFVVGSEPKAWLILKSTGESRVIEKIRITKRPVPPVPVSAEYRPPIFLSDSLQTCLQRSNHILLGNYGSLAKLTIDPLGAELIQEDEGMGVNRVAFAPHGSTLWVASGLGGYPGISLERYRSRRQVEHYWIRDRDDNPVIVDDVRIHQNRVLVGASHGLFEFNERPKRFTRFSILAGTEEVQSVTALRSDGTYLWVFIDGKRVKVDLAAKSAVHHIADTDVNLTDGVRFGEGWLLVGPSGVWLTEETTQRPNDPTPPQPPAFSQSPPH